MQAILPWVGLAWSKRLDMITRADCLALDESDDLAPMRTHFSLPANTIYLDGNSLGAQPTLALARAQQLITGEWGKDLIRSWNDAGWFDMPLRLGDLIAPLVGAAAGEIAVTDSTSVNLFKVLAAALRMQSGTRRRTIVSERGNFPSDLYIDEELIRWLDRGFELRLVDSPQELDAAVDDATAVVLLTQVDFRTGRLHDMHAITAHAHHHGALVIWDLAHSAGALPVDMGAAQVDFAVGCTYKYLNGGPGAPAFLYVPMRHHAAFFQPLSGWWAHAAPFAMQPGFEPAAGIRRALCGTQPILALALVESGLAVFAHTDMQSIRRKSLAQTDLFMTLVDTFAQRHRLTIVTPRQSECRGSHVSIAHEHGFAVMQALIAAGTIGDFRAPDLMRFGFTPLYTRFVDVWDAAHLLREILDGGSYAQGNNEHTPRTLVT